MLLSLRKRNASFAFGLCSYILTQLTSPGKSYLTRREEEEGSGTPQIRVPWSDAQQASPKTHCKGRSEPIQTQRHACAQPRVAPWLVLRRTVPRRDARCRPRHRCQHSRSAPRPGGGAGAPRGRSVALGCGYSSAPRQGLLGHLFTGFSPQHGPQSRACPISQLPSPP